MHAVLAELDLARAVSQMTGPPAALAAANAVLGVTPVTIDAQRVIDDSDDPFATDAPPSQTSHAQHRTTADVVDALTEHNFMRSRLSVAVAGGVFFGHVDDYNQQRVKLVCCENGPALNAFVGWRFDPLNAVGLHVAYSQLHGDYTVDYNVQKHPVDVRSFMIAAAFQTTRYDRLWGTLFLGLQRDQVTVPMLEAPSDTKAWNTNLILGMQAGVDAFVYHGHRIGLFGWVGTEPFGSVGFGGLTLGAAYRYY
jgi:hypothetical protein